MKKYSCYLLTIIFLCFYSHKTQAKINPPATQQKLYFIENKGQIKNQFSKARNDIQYSLQAPGITVFIGTGQIHYQFAHNISSSVKSNEPGKALSPVIEAYRMDVSLAGANKNAEIVVEDQQEYYENYYLPGCGANGATAHTCKKITYKNILPNIDWVLYIKDEKLEHEFVVRPGGDVSAIKLKYTGQTKLVLNDDGSLTATTPMGVIKEHAPVCYLNDKHKKNVAYQLHENVLGYKISGAEQTFVIDPALEWGTYYGPDTSSSPLYGVASDRNGHMYTAGITYAASTGNIATTGSYQSTYGGNEDAYLVKFDTSGHRLWATYYGGSGEDWAYAVTCDLSGNVYIGGYTQSTDSIATAGSHQTAPGATGVNNGLLAKFNSSGTRLWATYYGGDQDDVVYSVVCDDSLNVYIAGVATSTFNIATPGSFEPTFINPTGQWTAGFIAKFDSTGVRKWGTYYEAYTGTAQNDVLGVRACTDGNNIYITGYTTGTDSIATIGSWQPANAGSTDDFIAKFDKYGNRIWATFYGGRPQDITGSLACDDAGNLYLLGQTMSDTGIVSAGCFQPLRGGGWDAFLAKFNPISGMRIWGTYYGGPANESVLWSNISANHANNIFITGCTVSASGIASAGAWQTMYGGNEDAFLAAYDASGTQQWSTYYGGTGDDQSFACAFDGLNVYISGQTNSTTNIATPGSFDTGYSGAPLYNKGFLAKFANIDPDPIIGADSMCAGSVLSLSDDVPGGTWSSDNAAIATVDSTTGIVTSLLPGTVNITYAIGLEHVTLSITVNPIPTLSGSLTPPAICDTSLFNYMPGSTPPGAAFAWSRALIYGISNPAASGAGDPNELLHDTTVTPVAVSYSFTITAHGCVNTQSVTVTVDPLPDAGSITGVSVVCPDSAIIVSDMVAGGAWSVANASATISGNMVSAVSGGMDTVIYSVTNSCGTVRASFPIIILSTSHCDSLAGVNTITNTGAGIVQLFPNPAQTEITITARKINNVTISDLLGQEVYSEAYNNEEKIQVNIARLPAGIYIVKINGSVVRRLVKE